MWRLEATQAFKGAAFETRTVVGDHRGVSICPVSGSVRSSTQGGPQKDFDLGQRHLEEDNRIFGGLTDAHFTGQVDLGPIVDNTTQIPDPGS